MCRPLQKKVKGQSTEVNVRSGRQLKPVRLSDRPGRAPQEVEKRRLPSFLFHLEENSTGFDSKWKTAAS